MRVSRGRITELEHQQSPVVGYLAHYPISDWFAVLEGAM